MKKKRPSLTFNFSQRIERAGFTLIEMAMVLIIVGLLLGVGMNLFGVLVKNSKARESRNAL
jgi:prepilin-type N-terminal cleavage/methylation domain-containing protein